MKRSNLHQTNLNPYISHIYPILYHKRRHSELWSTLKIASFYKHSYKAFIQHLYKIHSYKTSIQYFHIKQNSKPIICLFPQKVKPTIPQIYNTNNRPPLLSTFIKQTPAKIFPIPKSLVPLRLWPARACPRRGYEHWSVPPAQKNPPAYTTEGFFHDNSFIELSIWGAKFKTLFTKTAFNCVYNSFQILYFIRTFTFYSDFRSAGDSSSQNTHNTFCFYSFFTFYQDDFRCTFFCNFR